MKGLFLGDCMDLFSKVEDNSVDLIITSPPYNLGNNHHTGTVSHKAYDDNMNEKEYQDWQTRVLDECHRVLRDDGSLFYNHKNRIKNGRQITPYEWIFKSKLIIKQEIVWINRSQNFDKIRFYPFTERIYWLVKNEKTKLTNTISHHDVFDWKEWKPRGIKGEHKRAFPRQLVSDIISCFPKSKVIMDPFCGSGTTLLVAQEKGKDYIGFEIMEKYYSLSKNKLKNEKRKP